MALVTCYDKDGNEHRIEGVDAREIGYSLAPPTPEQQATDDTVLDNQDAALNVVHVDEPDAFIEPPPRRGRPPKAE